MRNRFAFLDDCMTLGFERFADSLDTKGVLGVDLIVALERVPIRRDAFAALPSHLVVVVGGHPQEDAGGDWVGEVGLVFFGQSSVQSIDGGEFALWHLLHQRINFERRRDDESDFAGFLGKPVVTAVAVLGQALEVVELG